MSGSNGYQVCNPQMSGSDGYSASNSQMGGSGNTPWNPHMGGSSRAPEWNQQMGGSFGYPGWNPQMEGGNGYQDGNLGAPPLTPATCMTKPSTPSIESFNTSLDSPSMSHERTLPVSEASSGPTQKVPKNLSTTAPKLGVHLIRGLVGNADTTVATCNLALRAR